MKILVILAGLLLTGCTAYTPVGTYDYRPVVHAPAVYAPVPLYRYPYYGYHGYGHHGHGHHD